VSYRHNNACAGIKETCKDGIHVTKGSQNGPHSTMYTKVHHPESHTCFPIRLIRFNNDVLLMQSLIPWLVFCVTLVCNSKTTFFAIDNSLSVVVLLVWPKRGLCILGIVLALTENIMRVDPLTLLLFHP
jgi:hypothetical protein